MGYLVKWHHDSGYTGQSWYSRVGRANFRAMALLEVGCVVSMEKQTI